MTHDELLTRINKEIDDNPWEAQGWRIVRTIVELHEVDIIEGNRLVPPLCIEDGEYYPCPTIQAIEEELD